MTNEELATKLDKEINHIHERIMATALADDLLKLVQALATVMQLKEMESTKGA